jgi:NAD(P)-dependent dehydrogenase (short-subunit alcohol dehydrogenase family)
MNLAGRVAVVTGGAGGIGSALCRAFAAKGARVVVSDIDLAGAEAVAREIGGTAMGADVGREADLVTLVQQVEQLVGPIDLFCSNAGVAVAGGPEVPDAEWDRLWRINTMAHVWAARALVPDMLRRGSGYLVSVASAAGLVNGIGIAPYAVTKYAAVGFAEWLAITFGDRGLKVSCVCPLGVRTRMLESADPTMLALLAPDAIAPAAVADATVAGIEREEFLILPHPEVREYLRRKADDPERWLDGMRRLAAQVQPEASRPGRPS